MNTMMRSCLLCAVGFTAVLTAAHAQDAGRPKDIVVVLDVSGSMNQGGIMRDVQAYLEKDVLRGQARIGDSFSLILFGESARPTISRKIGTPEDIEALSRELSRLKADDDYTDLGIAMETLEGALASRIDGSATPLALFITDGKNAPPPHSPYAGKDISVDERFLSAGKKIAMKGWQLYVIGLVEGTDAPAVAASVAGSTLSSPSEALNPTELASYVAQSEKAAGQRAEENAAAGMASGAASSPAADEAPGSARTGEDGIPLIALLAGAGAAVALGIILLIRRKSAEKP